MRRAVVLLLVLSTFAPHATADADAPHWSLGDSWNYRLQPSDGSEHDDSHTVVVGFERVESGGSEHDAARVEISYRSADDAPWTHWYTQWWRLTDGAQLRSATHWPNGTTTEHEGGPCPDYVWPLRVGETQPICGGTQTVEARENVTTGAGTFDAYRVNHSLEGGYKVFWYAPSVCGILRNDFAYGENLRMRTELIEARCADPDGAAAAQRAVPATPAAVLAALGVAAVALQRRRASM